MLGSGVTGRRVLGAVVAVLLAGGGAAAIATTPSSSTPTSATPGLQSLLRLGDDAPSRGIVRLSSVASASQIAALEGLGLKVQAMRQLPLAIVEGPVAALADAVTGGTVLDVYPDTAIELFDTASAKTMGAATAWKNGFTGKGVTVAVVDSGCDATHADLADHVVHNVKLVGAEYANQPSSAGTIVVPIELAPYNNSDIGSGHGTHVAGIIAADGHTGAEHRGVAPDANLVCYAIGEVLFTTAVVSAYDHMLDQKDLWGIDVVNNSWGNTFTQFDPKNPINIATKAVADRGVTVVFAAGNNGGGSAEASLNPWSQAPWVLSVAAGTLDHERADFSSNGLRYDNSTSAAIGAGGHTVFLGEGLGLYHPDVTAPGADISSTCDSLGTVVGPCAPGSNTSASGTSMASPHVAGAAAVLLSANHLLTPSQVRRALMATTSVVPRTEGEPATKTRLAFWQGGYGWVEVDDAVALVRRSSFASDIAARFDAATAAVIARRAHPHLRSDFWTYAAPPLALGGSDAHTYGVSVGSKTRFIKITLVHPSLATLGGVNGFEYQAVVKDAAGRVLGQTTEEFGSGTATLQIDLWKLAVKPTLGRFTVSISGQVSISDPDTLDSDSVTGDVIFLQVAQLGS